METNGVFIRDTCCETLVTVECTVVVNMCGVSTFVMINCGMKLRQFQQNLVYVDMYRLYKK